MRALAAVVLLAACRPAAAPSGAVQADAATGPSCVDAELDRRGLNEYGDPRGTMYAGGTPLFDEKTGQTRDRMQYVKMRRPDIARACPTH